MFYKRTNYNSSLQYFLKIVPFHRTFSSLILLPLLTWNAKALSGLFSRKLSLISTQLITLFFFMINSYLIFSNHISLDYYLSSDSMVLISVIFIIKSLYGSFILGNYITQSLAKKVSGSSAPLLIFSNILFTVLVYILISLSIPVLNIFEALFCLRLAASITTFIYSTSLYLITYLKMFFLQ